jgi:hypothetical protein
LPKEKEEEMNEKYPIIWEVEYRIKRLEGRIVEISFLHKSEGWKTVHPSHPAVADLMEALEEEKERAATTGGDVPESGPAAVDPPGN